MIELIYTSHDGVKHFMAVDAAVADLPNDVRTGSDCLMVDTGEKYMFHQGTRQWYLQKSEGGGGGKELPEVWRLLLSDADVPEPLSLVDSELNCVKDDLFRGCDKLGSIELRNAAMIGAYAFFQCQELTRAVLPEVISLGHTAFGECRNLAELDIPKCVRIADTGLYHCESLEEILFPMVEEVAFNAISYCNSLESVCLPKCRTLGKSAISSNPILVTIDVLGDRNAGFGDGAMANNPLLKNVVVRSTEGVVPAGNNLLAATEFATKTASETDARIYVPGHLVSGYKQASGWSAYEDKIVQIAGSRFDLS